MRPAIEHQLQELLASPSFVNSDRLKRFLTLSVTRSLEGSQVTELEIGQDIFEKPDFDPRADSTVRTAAGRLRSKLREYYKKEGVDDLIVIDVPKGQYLSTFQERDPSSSRFGAEQQSSSNDQQPRPSESCLPSHDILRNPTLPHRWRRAAVLALAFIIVGVAGVNARSYLWTIVTSGRRPKLQRTVAIRPSVAVLDFSGSVSAPRFAELSSALTEMFRTEISVDGKLRAISGEDVARMERDLSLQTGTSLPKSSLALVRQYIGADFVVIGFGPFEEAGMIRFDVAVQNARTGELLASAPETGPESGLFSMVSTAGKLLRDKIGAGLGKDQDTKALRASLPHSEDARRLYVTGISRLRNFDALAARDFLLQAAAAEPASPRIQWALSQVWSMLGYEKRATEAAQSAMQFATALSPEELHALEAHYYELVHDWSGAVEMYDSLWQFFGDNPEYGLNLATARASAGDIDSAFKTLLEVRSLPSPVGDDPRIDIAEAIIAEMKGDFRREQKAAAAAASKAKERGARSLLGDAQLRQSWALNSLGDKNQALECAEHAKQIFTALGDQGGQARALKNIADVMDDLAKHQQAKTNYDLALAMFREIGNQSGVAVSLVNLGYTLKDLGDLDGSRRTFEKSIAVSQEIGNERLQAKALNGLAGVIWRKGNLLEASSIYQQAYSIFMSLASDSDGATVTGNIAIIFQQLGDLDKAQQKFELSLQIMRKLGDQEGEARTLGNLGDLLLSRGDLTLAKHRFKDQLSIGEKTGNQKQSAYALVGLGEVLTAEGNLGEARAKIEKAIALRSQAGEEGLAAEARVPLGTVLLEQGELSSAESEARKAISQFHRESEADDEASATALLALSLSLQGKIEDARRNIEQAMQRVEKTDDRGTKVDILTKYARISGIDARKAAGFLRAAIEDARRCGFTAYELEARLALGELEAKSGKPTAAVNLKTLQNDAAAHGFMRIAREAGALPRGVGH